MITAITAGMGSSFLGKCGVLFQKPTPLNKHQRSEYALLDRGYGPKNGLPENFIICDPVAPEGAILAVSNAYHAEWIPLGLEFELIAVEHQLSDSGVNYLFAWQCEVKEIRRRFDVTNRIDYLEDRIKYLQAMIGCRWMLERPKNREEMSRALSLANYELERSKQLRDGGPHLS
jgi:hypothetical protein